MENKDKEYYIYLNGEKIPVSEEIYKEYMRPIWRDERQTRRKWRCRDAHGVRCKKDCIECEIALLGEGATGNDLSLERLVENEDPELIGNNDPVDIAAIKEQLEIIQTEIEKLSEDNKTIINLLTKGFTQQECADILGISQPALNQRAKLIRKNLKKFLK